MARSMSRREISLGAALRTTVRTDTVAGLTLALYGFWTLVYMLLLLAGQHPPFVRRLLVLSLLVLGVAAFVRDHKRLRDREERRFWRDLLIGFSCWLAVGTLYLPFPATAKPTAVEVMAEVLLTLFYTFFLLAAERRPDRRGRWRPVGVERALTWPAVAVFMFGLYVYFALIPRVYRTPDSTIYLYVFLDAYLLVKLLYLQATAPASRWRQIYRLLAAALAAMLVSDALEVAQETGRVAWGYGSWPDLLTVLPLLGVVLAARLRHLRFPPEELREEPLLLSGPSGKTMISALAFPFVHFVCSAFGLLSPESKADREFVVGWWLFLLGTLALIQHRRLEHEADALWHDRKIAERALDRSEKDVRLMLERESTQEALQASEERFTKTFISFPEAIEIVSLASGLPVEVNPAFEQITGYRHVETVGRQVEFWDQPGERQRLVDDLRAGRRVRGEELVFRTRTGERRLGRVAAEIVDFDGEPCLLTIIEDITAKGEVDDRLRTQVKLVDEAEAALVAVDGHGTITSWNAAAERLYGWSSEEALGQPMSEMIGGERQWNALREAVEENGFWSGTLELLSRGKRRQLGARTTRLRAGGDDATAGLLVLTYETGAAEDGV